MPSEKPRALFYERAMRPSFLFVSSALLLSLACEDPELLALRPLIVVAETRIDFGDVVVGDARQVALDVQNIGDVQGRALIGAPAAPFAVEVDGVEIASGAF